MAAVRPLTETSQNQPGESSRRNNPIPEFIRRARDCSMVVAELHTDFERTGECGKSFDYSQLPRTTDASEARQQMNACMTAIQRGGHIQPFGCLILVEEASSKVIGYIENAHEMLGLNRDALGIGSDVFTLFSLASVAQLELALGDREMILNSVWIHSHSGRAFYAILHKIDVGIVMDLEPARIEDPDLSITRNLQTQRTTASEISKLESLPTANINLLYNTLVQSIRQLTGYDRVMVYKFHEDYHGEIVAESKKNELNPHIGLHYPATDIPQVSKCLSKVNRVRMIVDSQAPPVRIIQDESLTQPLSLVGSTLRAPHSCHNQYMANMGAIASLVLSIIINDDNVIGYGRFMRLWGLVLCHHSSPRSISYPDRNALEFLMRAFALQLNLELQLASQSLERHVLRTQNLLHSLFMREFCSSLG